MEENISSRRETLNQKFKLKRVTPIKVTHRRHHVPRQCSESLISLGTSQSDIDDSSESDFDYHNLPAVTENQCTWKLAQMLRTKVFMSKILRFSVR